MGHIAKICWWVSKKPTQFDDIPQNNITLPLHDVLLVPDLTKKLFSISQLTKQFPVNCEFSNADFCVKE